MNLLLHGIENPNIRRDNALKTPLKEIGEKDRFEVIVTNPPFGGEEEAGIQLNFPEATRASETALLFMQFVMRSLKPGGRCGIIVPNGFLFGDGVAARVKAQMLREFNLHTIVRLPNGVFAPYTSIPTNLLFFERTGPTQQIWFYEQPMREGLKNYTKTRPMQFDEFQELRDWWDASRRKRIGLESERGRSPEGGRERFSPDRQPGSEKPERESTTWSTNRPPNWPRASPPKSARLRR